MKTNLVSAFCFLLFCACTHAATRYVWQDSPSPGPPYDTWTNAAHVIQEAVDAALPGDEIVVTNGLYATGGRAVYGTMTNRVAVDKPLTLRSVNGPEVTIIEGGREARCAYLASGATLSGFTLTNGTAGKLFSATGVLDDGGGAWCESTSAAVSNCVLVGNSADWGFGGGAFGGTLDACTLVGNSALMGGGACEATLNNCTLADNYASGEVVTMYPGGGGAIGCTLNGCTLTNNTSGMCGGGALSSVLNNCKLVGNSADAAGGGACEDMMTNCTLAANSAGVGGGAYAGTLNNCALTGNTAGDGGGVYGGTVNNCTLVGNTVSGGGGGAAGSTLNKCSLTRNSAAYGGGAYAGTLNNCTLTGNSAYYGGGVSGSISMWNNDLPTLNNCMLTGNSAERGGAAYGGSLMNCTLTGNSAFEGGGAYSAIDGEEFFYCDLWNCIVFFNTATNGANYLSDGEIALIHCCTTPLATWGGGWYPAVGNITNAPLFVDYAGGNLRLQSNSPCVNAGNNAYAPGTVDLDGQSRIVSGTVDIGAYEYQGAGSVISYAWLRQFGLPTDGSVDAADLDLDGHSTWQEWRCLTDPTNALSALRLVSASPTGTNVIVTWQSVEGVSYFLERATSVSGSPPIFVPLATDTPGQPGTTTFTDPDAARLAPRFYRVGVSP